MLSVQTMDHVVKKIRVTHEMTASDLIDSFAEKINLKEKQFFQLAVVTDGSDRWLSMREPVVLQGCTRLSNIVLKLRFSSNDPLEVKDPVARRLYFLQIRDKVVRGDVPVGEEDAISLGALWLQNIVGDYEKKERRGYFTPTNIEDYIPNYLVGFHPLSWWEKKIFSAHQTLKGLDQDEVQSKYMKLVVALPNYGLTYFSGLVRPLFIFVVLQLTRVFL